MDNFTSIFRRRLSNTFKNFNSNIFSVSAIFFASILTSCSIDKNLVDDYQLVFDIDKIELNISRIDCAIEIYSISINFELDPFDKKKFIEGNTYSDDMNHLLLTARNCFNEIKDKQILENKVREFYIHVDNLSILHKYHREEGVLVVYSPKYSRLYFMRGDWD